VADNFDPYRKWLGIPEKDQPPHHYRLLNIEPFESDPEVISNAADSRMAQVKQYQSGKHSEASQRILNELAAAKVCLLNREKKADYDEELRARLRPEKPITLVPVADAEPATPLAPVFVHEAATRFESSAIIAARRKKGRIGLFAFGGIAAAAILIALAALQFKGDKGGDAAVRRAPEEPAAEPMVPSSAATAPPAASPRVDSAAPDRRPGKNEPLSAGSKPANPLAELFGPPEPERSLGSLVEGGSSARNVGGANSGEGAPPTGDAGSHRIRYGLLAEYFADQKLADKVFTRIDPQIQFDLGSASPAPSVPADFAARWTGWLVPPAPGTYRLITHADDGIRLWLDGKLLINRWSHGQEQRDEAEVELTAGPHELRVEYFDCQDRAVARLNWSRPGVFEEQPVPAESLRIRRPYSRTSGPLASAEPRPSGEPSTSRPSFFGQQSSPRPSFFGQGPSPQPSAGEAPAAAPVAAAEPKPAPARRLPVPDQAAQQKTQADVAEIFRNDLAAAKTPEKKAAVAQSLHRQAQSSGDDPNARFVLLKMACDLAAEGGDVAHAMELVGAMEQSFQVNAVQVEGYVLKKMTDSMPTGPNAAAVGQQIADAAVACADKCVSQDNYDGATGFVDLAMAAARKTKDPDLIQPLMSRDREIKRMKGQFESIRKAIDSLADSPDDPVLNLTAGRWFCFERGDWSKGLPMLAKGSDAALAKIAEKELAAPADPNAQVALADGWHEFAEKEKDSAKLAARRRAKSWYEQAQPSLEGLAKVKVEKRLKELSEAKAAGPAVAAGPKVTGGTASTRPVIQPGNVALASNGTTVDGVGYYAGALLDGSPSEDGPAHSSCPCEWTITFDKVYRLQAIAFLISRTGPNGFARYAVAISPDGVNYTPLIDCSQGAWKGWQRIRVPSKPVKSVKLFGISHATSYFYVAEFEAYCIAPK